MARQADDGSRWTDRGAASGGIPCYNVFMTRTEAIALITTKLASLDDERVQTVAEIVGDIAADDGAVRALTPREQGLLAQSSNDFKAGRTLSFDELVEELDNELAPLGVPKYRA